MLRRVRTFVCNPITVQFIAMGCIVQLLIQTRVINTIGDSFLSGFVMLFIMLFVFPNVQWKKPYFILPWKTITDYKITERESR